MQIYQEENGNIIIRNRYGHISHVLSSMSVQMHPRKENALLIESKDLQKGIEFLVNERVNINNKNYYDLHSILSVIGKTIELSGKKTPIDTTPKTKEQDPDYVAYLQANTYEKLLAFAKKHHGNTGGKNIQNGKLVEEEFFCQFRTFTIKVALRYHYRLDKPDLIKYIHMWGSTQYVTKNQKVYVYDENNTISGYVYKGTYENL